MDELERISHYLMIIVGILMFILGIIGNLLNICIFFRWSHPTNVSKDKSNLSTKSNGSLYLLVSSTSNLIIILYPLLTRIIFDGFQYSITEDSSFVLCKFRYYILHTFDLISLTCICMATFDRYLLTSRQVRIRNLSPMKKRTEQMILLIIILNIVHSIPIGFYFDVSKSGDCLIESHVYFYYYLVVFQIILHSLMPIVFLSIFGTLTYRHLKKLKHTGLSRSDKHLSHMLLLMSVAIVLSSIPYCIEYISYIFVPFQHSQPRSFLYLYHVITSILFYTNPVTSFYIFYISTPNFRKHVKKIVLCRKSPHDQQADSLTTLILCHNSCEQKKYDEEYV